MVLAIAFNQQSYNNHKFQKLQQKLENIATTIKITSDLTITYGDSESLEVPLHLQNHLKALTSEDCERYLAAKLQKHLYDVFGELEVDRTVAKISDCKSSVDEPDEKGSNYVNKWSRTKFYQQLTSNNHGRGYGDPDWIIVGHTEDYWQARKNGLTLNIKPERHLVDPPSRIQIGDLVTLKMPANLVDRGIYIAVGDAGTADNKASEQNCPIVQLYFHVNSQGALSLLDSFTQKLNAVKIPFNFKVPYSEAEFDDYDTVILEFSSKHFEKVYQIVEPAYRSSQGYFAPQVPFFCQYIAPGFGLAQKPIQANFPQENIGQNYCGILARALIDLCRQRKTTDSEKLSILSEYISDAGMDLNCLYLNPDSTEVYLTESIPN